MKDMGYTDTFIQVAADCPAPRGEVPAGKRERKPIHVLQYELLSAHPYRFTHADLLYEVHVRHKAIAPAELKTRGPAIRKELLEKPHPCLRACLLPKKYGWGVHYNEQGRIALYARESEAYHRFTQEGGVANLVTALRSRRP